MALINSPREIITLESDNGNMGVTSSSFRSHAAQFSTSFIDLTDQDDIVAIEDSGYESDETLRGSPIITMPHHLNNVYQTEQTINPTAHEASTSNVNHSPFHAVPLLVPQLDINYDVCPGTDIELVDGTFFRIKDMQSETRQWSLDSIVLFGYHFIHTGNDRSDLGYRKNDTNKEDIACLVPQRLHEIVLLVDRLQDDNGSDMEQAVIAIPLTMFKRVVNIKMTNRQWPELNTLIEEYQLSTGIQGYHRIADRHPLICRWKGIKSWVNARKRKSKISTYCERIAKGLDLDECDPGYGISQSELLMAYRPETIRGGSYRGEHEASVARRLWEERETERAAAYGPCATIDLTCDTDSPCIFAPTIDLTDDEGFQTTTFDDTEDCSGDELDDIWNRSTREMKKGGYVNLEKQTYSFADYFSGGGGSVCGAKQAGLTPVSAVDFERDMCETLCENNPALCVACTSVQRFVANPKYMMIADVVHLSPPCCFFSKAHTTPGKDDEMNKRALDVIGEVIRRTRPRIVTLENADGIYVQGKHWEFMQAIMLQMTTEGYSVRAKVLNFCDYGVPQRRARLMIIASCPGQDLPEFPLPTHSEFPSNPNIKPWVSCHEAIRIIPDGWDDHNPEAMKMKAGEEWDSRKICGTLTTKSSFLHPEGWRYLTIRELACIQTFPLSFKFGHDQTATSRAKQIGNAVPPAAIKTIFEEIRRCLLRSDGLLS